jgi:hypothetical protein
MTFHPLRFQRNPVHRVQAVRDLLGHAVWVIRAAQAVRADPDTLDDRHGHEMRMHPQLVAVNDERDRMVEAGAQHGLDAGPERGNVESGRRLDHMLDGQHAVGAQGPVAGQRLPLRRGLVGAVRPDQDLIEPGPRRIDGLAAAMVPVVATQVVAKDLAHLVARRSHRVLALRAVDALGLIGRQAPRVHQLPDRLLAVARIHARDGLATESEARPEIIRVRWPGILRALLRVQENSSRWTG